MLTRGELEHKLKLRNAQLSLRVVAFSILLIAPFWIAAYVAERLGFSEVVQTAYRPGGLALLAIYGVCVWRIVKRTGKQQGVRCDKCGADLGLWMGKILSTGTCPKCGEKIVR